ncbi:MAG: class I SAM-dependent methyltransferase [Actinobacteria bacterium]|nr:class I SAM-dependent methyltransferase [Actinomycetota bacterium]
MDRLRREIDSFRGTWKGRPLWEGGYYEGDPLDPVGRSSYGAGGYISVLHAVYLTCVRPYVNADTLALELGPGRGAWTRALLPAREVWAVDVLSADHNGFWDYVGRHDHVRYVEATDFSLNGLPADHFSYVFSFGTLCHVSFEGISEYARNLKAKLRPGANCFWMVADYEKVTRSAARANELLIGGRALPRGRRGRLAGRLAGETLPWRPLDAVEDDKPATGRWYHAGAARTCEMLASIGYHVVEQDVGAVHRDPIIHFRWH